MKDKDFVTNSRPITRREIRSFAIDQLDVLNAGVLLDIGASTGTVSIEASLLNPRCNVICIETNKESLEVIGQNIKKYDASVALIEGEAPFAQGSQAEKNLKMALVGEKIDRVYIGGTRGKFVPIVDWLKQYLADGAIIAVEAMTIETSAEVIELVKSRDEFYDIEGTQISASRLALYSDYNYFFEPVETAAIFAFKYKHSN